MLAAGILKGIFAENSNLVKGILKANSLALLPRSIELFNNILLV